MLVRPFVSRVCLFFVVSLPACDCYFLFVIFILSFNDEFTGASSFAADMMKMVYWKLAVI
jgi:hypothetical protein